VGTLDLDLATQSMNPHPGALAIAVLLEDVLPVALPIAGVLALVLAATHAVLNVRDARAATGWVGIIVVLPLVGAILYWLLGINRVHRRAVALLRGRELHVPKIDDPADPDSPSGLLRTVALPDLARLIDVVTVRSLLRGNAVTPLVNGDEAYPAMLAAIASARHTVTLATYIFDRDKAGLRFVDALAAAVRRGVQVRVLVDAVGARYSFPTIVRTLAGRRVPVARFNPTLFPWRWTYANLRNHRKIMVVDGHVGFTGGMNFRQGHCVAEAPRRPVLDLHFKIEGPVVAHMQRTFVEDWAFATHERLEGSAWFPPLQPVTDEPSQSGPRIHDVVARGISDGPDIDIDKMRWAIHGALACAKQRVRITTPYFLPESDLIAAMITAVMRGVEVEVIVSEKNNQLVAKWASEALLPELVNAGCSVWKTLGPFDHSKVVVVDESWVLIGSTNFDPRSLRLNFEFNIECHSPELARHMSAIVDVKRTGGRLVTTAQLAQVGLLRRVRSGLARLFLPYL